MRINNGIRQETQRRLRCQKTAYYRKVDEVRERYGTISREEAAYVLAAEHGVDLTKYLGRATCDKVMDIRSKLPVEALSIGTQKRATPEALKQRRGGATEQSVQRSATASACRRTPRQAIDCVQLHPKVVQVARKLFRDGHCAQAVESALKLFNNSVKKKAGHPKGTNGHHLDGAALMTTVFSVHSPILRLNSLKDDSDRDEQRGYMQIAQGTMIGLRNPRAHEHELKDDLQRALELLALASHLMKRLDSARRVRRGGGTPP